MEIIRHRRHELDPHRETSAHWHAVTAAGTIGVGLVGLFDLYTGNEISVSILYELPIAAAVWSVGKWSGLWLSILAAMLWLKLDLQEAKSYSHWVIPYWNASVRLGFFLLSTVLLSHIRFLVRNLESIIRARTDDLRSEVAQRQQAESIARDSAERFRQLAENIRDVFWMKDSAKDEILYVSPSYEAVWGESRARLHQCPQSWFDSVHPDDKARVQEAALSQQIPGLYDEEYRILRPDGSLRWIHDRAFPVRNQSGKIYRIVGVAEDITRRKNLEREVARISVQEQQRIAHELHDHIGAYLAGLAFRAQCLAESLSVRKRPEADDAHQLVTFVNTAAHQVRNLSHLLAMDWGPEDSLSDGLSRLGEELEMLFGITCTVKSEPSLASLPRLASDQGRQLYRIAQEAARNAIQHGKARTVGISLRHQGKMLELLIENDGALWEPASEPGRSLGLRIMNYRAGTLGGTLSLQPGQDGKATVRCQVPFQNIREALFLPAGQETQSIPS
ncbi:MAG: PAS domain-containing protein [Verrucomicrobiota bacterium]